MTKFGKKIRRAACVALSTLTLGTAMLAFSSCASDFPKATVTISFNEETYTISYKLYRAVYPQTVQHFIELAESKYYDGLCVHSYVNNDGMYTGRYEYNEDAANNLKERNYNAWIEEHGNVEWTKSVYTLVDDGVIPSKDKALNTVVGEYKQTIENNDKRYGSKKDGALVMYSYYSDPANKSDFENQYWVTTQRNTARNDLEKESAMYDQRDYVDNSATSMFYINMKASSVVSTEQTVFAELYDDNAEEAYNDLRSAIRDYINKLSSSDEFAPESGNVTLNDRYFGATKVTYKVPVSPIVIESVKINRK